MDESLENFLTKIRRDLELLTAEERESRLDAISEQLARDMAAYQEQGLEEEAAVLTAIQRFEAVHRGTFSPSAAQTEERSGRLSPTVTSALYCAFTGRIVAFGLSSVFWWFVDHLSATSIPARGPVNQGLESLPSLVVAVAAGVFLLFHDGFSGIVSTIMSPQSVPGVGVRWNALKQVFVTLLMIVLMLVLPGAESPIVFLLAAGLVLLMPGAAFLAGWLVARAAPKSAVAAVTVAAVTTGILTFTDQCFWVIVNDIGSSFSIIVAILVFLLLIQVLLAGLAIAGARIGSQSAKQQ